jgi:hypothetical protein
MGTPYLRPSVAELAFQLYRGPLHPELFDVLATRTVARDDGQVTVRIVRTGHVITWQSHNLCLTEVTAAADLPLPERRCLLHHRMKGEHSATLQAGPGISYQVSFQVEALTPEVFLHVHDEILVDGGKRGLLHNFQPHHRLAVSPLSFVTVEARPDCLFLTTFHTFPDENTVVKSQSLIEKRKT